MSLPWLRDDYKRPESRSRSRSSSASRSRQKSEDRRPRSRSRSPKSNNRDFAGRGRDVTKGRAMDKGKRRHSSSSSASSNDSHSSTTRLVASTRPKYVNARIFVANINSKEITKAEIVNHFEKYGNVVDCLIHPKNYIFVQFLKEDHARFAVEGENGSTLNGFRMDVKMANENRKGGQQQNRRDHQGGRNNDHGGRPPRDRGDRGDRDRDRDPYGPDPFIHDRRPPPPFPPPGGEYGARDPYFPPDPYRRGGYPPDPWMPPEDPYRRDPFADPYRDPYAARAPPPPAHSGPVECEVFIVNPQLRTYGEIIERRVKDQSIIGTLSIIPEGRTAPQMVEELTVKGGLFAIFLNAQNETHRSLTLNILHGTPQEHRNMPLDDAIGLIGRSFEKYVEELRAKANAGSIPASSSGTSVGRVFLPPSSEVTYLLNLLADNRALTVAELDTVIKYLQERREKLVDGDKRPVINDDKNTKSDKRERAPSETSSKASEAKKESESQSTHEELTKKILSIFQGVDPSIASKLTQSSSTVAQVPAPQPAPPPALTEKMSTSGSNSSGGANLINFDNPNVQRALNNLIQSGPDLLRNFSSGSEPPPPVTSGGIMSHSSINPAPALSSSGLSGIPSSHGMGMPPHQSNEMAMAMAAMQQGGGDMAMGMFGQQSFDNNLAALTAANLAAFNMHGMQAMGAAAAMGGAPDFNNYSPMPPMGGGAQPPPPPPNQRY